MVEPREPYQIPKENPCNGCRRKEKRIGCHAECYDHMIYSITQNWEREEQKKVKEVDKYTNKKKYPRRMIRNIIQEGQAI